MTNRCKYCGHFFVPDARAVKTQKACARAECKKARKREAHKKWCEDNPESFKNHYRDYVVPYRQRKRGELPSSSEVKAVDKIKDRMPEVIKDKAPPPMIKDGIPPLNPLVELVLLIPGDAVGMIPKVGASKRKTRYALERLIPIGLPPTVKVIKDKMAFFVALP